MSIEDRAKDTEGKMSATADELPDSSADKNTAGNDRQLEQQFSDSAEDLQSQDRHAVVTIEDQCKDLKENATPSFQEIEGPDPTLGSTSSKAKEFKSNLDAKAEQVLAQDNENSQEKHSVTKSD